MPSKSAQDIEAEIAVAADVLGLSSLGLWTKMRRWIETSSHAGHLEIDGQPGTLERLSQKLKRSPVLVSRLVSRLGRVSVPGGSVVALAVVSGEGVIHSPPLRRKADALTRNAAKQDRHRKRGLYNPVKGVTRGVTAGVTPPPDGFPLKPPSLPPPDLHMGAGLGADEPGVGPIVDDALREQCFQAFDLWARASFGRPLEVSRNEHRLVFRLIETAAQEPGIVQGGHLVPRQLLIPRAAEFCRLNGKEFKGVAYAVKTAESTLDEWSRKGMPGAGAVAGAPPPRRPAVTRKYAS